MKLVNIVGARPNFMKIAPIIDALNAHNGASRNPIEHILVHTGQHYDEKMSKLFFEDLGIPKPDIDLGVGSGTHAMQTAEIMVKFEKVCLDARPTHILVVGDVNSTIACALVASKLGIKVIHVEAGLRSFDRTMPEEINRVLTDAISDYLFITEKSASENLLKEGVPAEKVYFVGNVMIDTLIKHREKSLGSSILGKLGLAAVQSKKPSPYCVLTLHRPSNVDDPETLRTILETVHEFSAKMPVVFPVHPRTRKMIEKYGLGGLLDQGLKALGTRCILAIEPQGYLDFLALISSAGIVMTDSGGIQEETTVLGVPCVTLRNNTERPVTVTDGTNVIAGMKKDDILRSADSAAGKKDRRAKTPPLWDGKAAERIVSVLASL